MPIVLKSGSLSLLEPSGPAQVCNGIALHYFTLVTFVTRASKSVDITHRNAVLITSVLYLCSRQLAYDVIKIGVFNVTFVMIVEGNVAPVVDV